MNTDIEQYFVVRYVPGKGFEIDGEMTWGGDMMPQGSVLDNATGKWIEGDEKDHFQLWMTTQCLSMALNKENSRVGLDDTTKV